MAYWQQATATATLELLRQPVVKYTGTLGTTICCWCCCSCCCCCCFCLCYHMINNFTFFLKSVTLVSPYHVVFVQNLHCDLRYHCMSICLFVYLFVSLFVCLSVMSLLVSLFVHYVACCLSVHLPCLHLSLH